MRRLLRHGLLHWAVSAVMAASCLIANTASAQSVIDETLLADAEGGRWAISVRTLDGVPVSTVNAEQRIVPASTIKLITTAAAFHYLGDYSNAGWPAGTGVYLEDVPGSPYPDLILQGTGDATLSDEDSCVVSCLQQIAVALNAAGVTGIGDIRVDDSLFRKPYWPVGWAHDDLRFAYGTAISALSVNDGAARAAVSPGPSIGEAPRLDWRSVPAFNVDVSRAETSRYGFDLEFNKQPGSAWAEITGTIGLNAGRVDLRFGLDDPSMHTGRLFRQHLVAAGITVAGQVVRHDKATTEAVSGFKPRLVYRQARPDPENTLTEILHESNNVHSEILLQHVSLVMQDPTPDAAILLMEHLLLESGARDIDFDIADGSGLSFYNRITPHAMTGFLSWASQQGWFGTWADLLPRSGIEGTMEYRLTRGVAAGTVRAKTGTVFGADGLAGYFTGASGQDYAFAIYLNDSAMSHAEARGRIDGLVRHMIGRL